MEEGQCLVTVLSGSPAEEKAKQAGLMVQPVAVFNLFSLFRLREIGRLFDPDLVIVYGGAEMAMLQLLPEFGTRNRPTIRFRGHALTSRNLQYPRLFAWSHRSVQMVITPGKGLAEKMDGILQGRVPVRPVVLGIDTEFFFRSLNVCRKPRPELLLFGRFDPVKGHEKFIRIFSKFKKIWSSRSEGELLFPVLHIVGCSANLSREQIEKMGECYGLRPGQELQVSSGRVHDVRQLMMSACLGVIASLDSEEICRVAQEFLLCGTPVFLSGAGALREVLFMNAGLCYGGKTEEEAAEMLYQYIPQCFREDHVARELRATMAKSYFSLQAMGHELSASLSELL